MSGIAALPRIVTLHDIEIKPDNKDAFDQLTLDLTAKTYRYLDEEELAGGREEEAPSARITGQRTTFGWSNMQSETTFVRI